MNWIFLALLSAFFAALVAILGKMGLKNIDTTLATTLRSIVMAAILILATVSLQKFDFSKVDRTALVLVFLSGLAGALSWLFYFSALKNGPASGVAAVDRLSIIFILVLAVLFLGESLTWKSGLGALLVAAGAIFLAI